MAVFPSQKFNNYERAPFMKMVQECYQKSFERHLGYQREYVESFFNHFHRANIHYRRYDSEVYEEVTKDLWEQKDNLLFLFNTFFIAHDTFVKYFMEKFNSDGHYDVEHFWSFASSNKFLLDFHQPLFQDTKKKLGLIFEYVRSRAANFWPADRHIPEHKLTLRRDDLHNIEDGFDDFNEIVQRFGDELYHSVTKEVKRCFLCLKQNSISDVDGHYQRICRNCQNVDGLVSMYGCLDLQSDDLKSE